MTEIIPLEDVNEKDLEISGQGETRRIKRVLLNGQELKFKIENVKIKKKEVFKSFQILFVYFKKHDKMPKKLNQISKELKSKFNFLNNFILYHGKHKKLFLDLNSSTEIEHKTMIDKRITVEVHIELYSTDFGKLISLVVDKIDLVKSGR